MADKSTSQNWIIWGHVIEPGTKSQLKEVEMKPPYDASYCKEKGPAKIWHNFAAFEVGSW